MLEENIRERVNDNLPNRLTLLPKISRVECLSDSSSPRGKDPVNPESQERRREISPLLATTSADNIYLQVIDDKIEKSKLSAPFNLPLAVLAGRPTLSLATKYRTQGDPMLCKRCAVNGNRRNGGVFGVCKTHAKKKCSAFRCEAATMGDELCTAHAHEVELARWTARAQLRVIEPGADLELAELRKEKLTRAKFLAHESVEVFFRSLLAASEALYGDTAEDEKDRAA